MDFLPDLADNDRLHDNFLQSWSRVTKESVATIVPVEMLFAKYAKCGFQIEISCEVTF